MVRQAESDGHEADAGYGGPGLVSGSDARAMVGGRLSGKLVCRELQT